MSAFRRSRNRISSRATRSRHCRENELRPACRRGILAALFRSLPGRPEALRRRLGDLPLRARADGADPQALAGRQIRHRAARSAVRCCHRFMLACWSLATRRSATSRRPGPRSASAPRASRVPKQAIDPRWLRYDWAGMLGSECRALHRRGRARALPHRPVRRSVERPAGYLPRTCAASLASSPGRHRFRAAADQQDDPHRLAPAPA